MIVLRVVIKEHNQIPQHSVAAVLHSVAITAVRWI
jgi:hypothetical protein